MEISDLETNSPDSLLDLKFGRFTVVANPQDSQDLGKRVPAEGLLRAFEFESKKPIKFGASLGQSIQAVRFITGLDEIVLKTALARASKDTSPVLDIPFGLWTKCDSSFASYFIKNWRAEGKPLAFLLYNSPPALLPGAPIFIHSDKNLRLLASFRESQYVSGFKNTVEADERSSERDRIWSTYRNDTVDPPARKDFNEFWDRQTEFDHCSLWITSYESIVRASLRHMGGRLNGDIQSEWVTGTCVFRNACCCSDTQRSAQKSASNTSTLF